MNKAKWVQNIGAIFSRLQNFNLTTKLTGLFLGLVIGYMAIGYAYYEVQQTENELSQINEKILSFEHGVREVEIDLLAAKQYESQFYSKKYPILLSKFDTRIISASQNVGGLINLIKDEKELEVITTHLGNSFEDYRGKFITAAEAMLEIGLDETQGLQGQMRNAVHDVETTLNESKSSTLMISMLNMRRHEKDYLARSSTKYVTQFNNEFNVFISGVKRSKLSKKAELDLLNGIQKYRKAFLSINKQTEIFNTSVKTISFTTKKIEPLFNDLIELSNGIINKTRELASVKNANITTFFISTLIVTLILLSITLYLISSSIVRAMKVLQNTVIKVNDGDMEARAALNRKDELGQLGDAFDKLLDERLKTLSESEKDTEILNESVIDLIRSVSTLAQNKDLAVKIPVSEDITGAIGDSLNLLSKEISNTLQDVKETSSQVASVSNIVKDQSDHVIDVANLERLEVVETAVLLSESVVSMKNIAKVAKDANSKATSTIQNTENALETVMSSMDGINSIRSTIGETEKRIKRLGERSQEITGIVNLINSIAERTHILALNASMHAASAGEAGRGFAVVADEVQRLAENAREATSEISTLVNNIRVETTDTVTTMNTAISQVAEGTRLAEQASKSMKLTQQATLDLVGSVKDIAERSERQAIASSKLLEKATQIQNSTEQTGKELQAQTKNTDRLVQYSADLVSSVGVFKLPNDSNKVTPVIDDKLDEPEELMEAI